MEVMQGYKKTEVGIIPTDWQVEIIGEAFEICNNLRLPISEIIRKKMQGNYPYYGPTKIQDYINVYRVEGEYSLIGEDGDHFLKWRDAPMTQLASGKFNVNNHAHLIKGKANYSTTKWFYYFFKNRDITQYLTRQGAGRYKLSKGGLKVIPIAIPPTIVEQTAIATVLSDTDALISSLERLIAKKHNIKQGAMQQLLQPKEEWELMRLGDIGKCYGGLSGKSKPDFEKGNCPYIPFMNIMSNPVIDPNYLSYVLITAGESQNSALKGDLFFNGSSETPEEVGMCSVLMESIPNLYLNSFCFGFRLKPELHNNGLFLSYFFRSSLGRKIFYSSAQGATRYNLSKNNFLKLEIHLPKPEEQNRIATIISDMDKEIFALEDKLEKYKQIKQGMMENLLTGKIRLV